MSFHLHFDAFNGISGDMMLGALVDLGVEIASIRDGLSKLPIGPFELRAESVKRSGIVGTRVHVEVEEESHPHAHLRHIIDKVEAAQLPPWVTGKAVEAYRLLAEAEAHVHGSTPEKIHFHEVGAKDAIVDIAGAMLGVYLLGAKSFSSDAVVVGTGSVKCAHGIMPVPAPATAEILKSFPIRSSDIEGEMTTPTGAAILQVLSGGKTRPNGFAAESIGYGAGSRDVPGHPNYLRLVLGRGEASGLPVDLDTVVELETEIDDMSPEWAGYLMTRLFEAGARDVHMTAVQMKKGRPGTRLSVLADPSDRDVLASLILRESTSFGLRLRTTERFCLRRRMEEVSTPWGSVEVKVGLWDGRVIKVKPEFESCQQRAREGKVLLREVYSAAEAAIQKSFGSLSSEEPEGEAT